MKTLLMDVGNSRVKWGVLDNGKIRRTGHVAQDRIRERGLQALTTRIPHNVDQVFVSNVAGNTFGVRLSGVVGMHCNCDVRFAQVERSGWGVTNGYRQPRRLGVDRWVAMVGAWGECHSACLVADAGTAVTLDAIDADGRHLGGQIIAGVEMMMRALSTSTSDIPAVKTGSRKGEDGLGMFAASTADAVREGARNAVAGAVDRAFRALQSDGYQPVLVLTGGDASRILNALGETPLHRPHLVLQGLAYMLDNPR